MIFSTMFVPGSNSKPHASVKIHSRLRATLGFDRLDSDGYDDAGQRRSTCSAHRQNSKPNLKPKPKPLPRFRQISERFWTRRKLATWKESANCSPKVYRWTCVKILPQASTMSRASKLR